MLMIAFACASCQKKLSVKDELAGQKVKCPSCGQVMAVPQAAATLARQAESKSANLEDAQTLPPAPRRAAQDWTLPSRSQGGRESLANAAGQTAIGGDRPGEATRALPAQGVDPELIDFLAPPEAGDELGRLGGFRILKILGHGGMGVVYQGEDPKLGRKVALKAMLPHLAGSRSAQQRFLREAKTAAALEHDHIVAIHHVGEDRGAPFIVMPFLKGEPLDQRLQREGKLPMAEVVRIGRETAEGLAAAHEHGLIHRDIKPANLWLEEPKGRVKILDFGLARAAADEAHLTQTGAVVGTPAYMAPEQAAGAQVDARCDLFSLGCVLYRLSTGVLPFKGKDSVSTLVAVATEKPRPPAAVNPEVPPALSDLVMRLLAKKPEQRPESAQTVAATLQDIEGQTATWKSRPQPKPRPGQEAGTVQMPAARPQLGRFGKKRRPWLWLVAAGVLGLGMVAAIILFWRTSTGTVRIESDDPSVEIVFDQTGPTIKGADKEPITLRAGEHGLLVKRGDFSFETDKLLIKRGQAITLKVELLAGTIRIVQDGQVLASRDMPLAKNYRNRLGMEFVLVPKGKSWLGGGGGRQGHMEVEITHDFYLGKYEVTQAEWQKVTGLNPSHFTRTGPGQDAVKDIADADLKRFPVESVSWEDAQLFIKRLNRELKEAGWVYRLPTEAEWEYACRGGPLVDKFDSAFDFYFQKPTNQLLPDQANSEHKGLKRTCKVGSYAPNRLGLYDMHGNVWEWCADWFDPNYYQNSPKKDPQGPESSPEGHRVMRGGGWDGGGWTGWVGGCQAAERHRAGPGGSGSMGLRLARVQTGTEIVKTATEEKKSPSVEAKLPPTHTNSLGMEFILVPKGKSWLGGGGGKPVAQAVEILHDFYLGKYEVTQEEWQKLLPNNPSRFARHAEGKDHVKDVSDADLKRFPVEWVSWQEAQVFLERLNKQVKEPGWIYRLPREAEWEYACRGGPLADKAESAFDFCCPKPANVLLPAQANFSHGQVLKGPCKVGSYPPNPLGLYDMHGNVSEWCEEPLDPKGPQGASIRVTRGGSWLNGPDLCRAASRSGLAEDRVSNTLGLRLARVPVGKEIVKHVQAPANR
jgi:formylglycine-generating enzyme required for sulfatase activity/serine/threonine protein kinase